MVTAREYLTVWSLNGGRFIGSALDEVPQTVRWLRSLANPSTCLPDVLCLQDFRVSLLKHLSVLPHFEFMPMTNHVIFGERELVGIAIASRYPLTNVSRHFTWGDGQIRDLKGVDDCNARIEPYDLADSLILETEARCLAVATVLKENSKWRIATTHGFWTRNGIPTAGQCESTKRLCICVVSDAYENDGLVLIGDLNLDRQGKTLRSLEASGGRDLLPAGLCTTLAPDHPGAKFGAKPDRVMTWPSKCGQYRYETEHVGLDFSAGSDHGVLCATLSRSK